MIIAVIDGMGGDNAPSENVSVHTDAGTAPETQDSQDASDALPRSYGCSRQIHHGV